MHANSEHYHIDKELWHAAIWTWPSSNGQHWTCPRSDSGNLWRVVTFTRPFQMLPAWNFKTVTQMSTSDLAEIPTSLPVVTTWCRQILRYYHIEEELQEAAIWTWQKVNIELVQDFGVENISVNLHEACYSWGVIMFTRQPDLEQVGRFKRSHKGQYRTHLICWCGEHPHKVRASYRQTSPRSDCLLNMITP